MKSRFSAMLLLLFLGATAFLVAQDTGEEEPAAGPAATLFDPTLRRDIETAGFYELVAWLEGLSQSTGGDKDALARSERFEP